MAVSTMPVSSQRQALLDKQRFWDSQLSNGDERRGAQLQMGMIRRQLAALDATATPATAPKPAAQAAAVAAAPSPAALFQQVTAPPMPTAPTPPAAVTNPEAAVAPTIAAAGDRADVALQQSTAAQPGEDEATKARRKMAERAFLGRTTGILTGVRGAATSAGQIGTRSLLGGTA